ncbi:MAG: hypothetical protein LC118_12440, partial [Dehalococcoidia bacterium]|nr:hypothetical protein [Dehalococcoidia bacterium]
VYRAFTDIESLKEAVEALESGRVPTHEERSLQLPFPDGEGDEAGPRLLQDVESRHYAETAGVGQGAAG